MKALNYMEYCEKLRVEWLMSEDTEIICRNIFTAYLFYSQPFSADLIEKYFEGWIKGFNDNYVTEDGYIICASEVEGDHFGYTLDTLDDFINIFRSQFELTFNATAKTELTL